jgi:hypothetical protein
MSTALPLKPAATNKIGGVGQPPVRCAEERLSHVFAFIGDLEKPSGACQPLQAGEIARTAVTARALFMELVRSKFIG